jgi:hypothetical protein
MKRYRFLIVLFIYVAISITGIFKFSDDAYLENKLWNRVATSHLTGLCFSALIMGILLFYLYTQWEAKKYQERKNRKGFTTITLALYIVLAFMLNAGCLFHVDTFFGSRGSAWVNGVIANKSIRLSTRGAKEYFMHVNDTTTKQDYYFKIKRRVYEHYNRFDTIHKQFTVSRLGIIYRKEL